MITGLTLARGRIPISINITSLKTVRLSHRSLHSCRHHQYLTKLRQPKTQFSSPRSILWSYASAPTNLLFVGTNLLGLGVFGAWRLLHTTVNPVVKSSKIENEFDGFVTNFEDSYDLKESVYVNEDGDEVYPVEGLGLPLTETDLNTLGPAKTRSVYKEHSNQTIVRQLLTLYHIHNSFGLIINEEGVNVETLTAMPDNIKESFVMNMMTLVPEENHGHIRSFSDLISHINVKELITRVRAESLSNDFILYKSIRGNLTLDQLESLATSSSKDSLSLLEVIRKYKTQEQLDTTFLLEAASSFMAKSINSINFEAAYEQMNKYPINENFKILGNLLTIHLWKSRNLIHSEKLLQLIIENIQITRNAIIFEKYLRYLNISPALLARDKSKKANYVIRKITHGSSLKNYSYQLSTYLSAIKGMYLMDYPETHIENSIKKLLKSLTAGGRVLYFNDFKDINSFSLNFDGFEIKEDIDVVLRDLLKKTTLK